MNYIYESPDNGQTIYRRKSGQHSDRELVSVSSEKQQLLEQQAQWDLWKSILEASKNNLALQDALDRVCVIYELGREHN